MGDPFLSVSLFQIRFWPQVVPLEPGLESKSRDVLLLSDFLFDSSGSRVWGLRVLERKVFPLRGFHQY